jgi:hypothetical protein
LLPPLLIALFTVAMLNKRSMAVLWAHTTAAAPL